MKVILIKDVKGQGKKDDIIEVSVGYANNYLIKNKLAVLYTPESKKILDSEIKKRNDEENARVEEFNKIKNKLENQTFNFKVKANNGKVFGTISSKQISSVLLEKGFQIDKKCIFIDGNIDSLGNHIVKITLHKKVSFNINVNLTEK